jgi:hypothetical protein
MKIRTDRGMVITGYSAEARATSPVPVFTITASSEYVETKASRSCAF